MSVQRFIVNRDNELLNDDTVIDVSSVEPISGTAVLKEYSKEGTGSVKLSGTYTGKEDCEIEIEITSESSSNQIVSQPQFSGVGNGTLENLAVTGLESQQFTIELIDLGTRTTYATYEFAGIVFRAKVPGSAGNSITITVDRSKLKRVASGFILHNSIGNGVTNLGGLEWNFGGAYPLNANGELHEDTKRIVFGNTIYPVYRQYIEYINGNPICKLYPATAQTYKAGTPVYFIENGYTVTITDTSTGETEKYQNIITLYELLTAIRSQSNLLDIDGIVVNDRTPGGQNAIDIPFVTSAYLSEITTEGSQFVNELSSDNIALVLTKDAADTDTIRVRCKDNSIVGGEIWDVSSTRGIKSTATTGKLFTDSAIPVTFRIPPKEPPEDSKRSIRVRKIEYAQRNADEQIPPICVDLLTLGAAAKTSTITLTYRVPPSPAENCECEDVEYDGQIKTECLGVSPDDLIQTEGGDVILNWRQQKIMSEIYSWKDSFIRNNTDIASGTGTFPKENSDVLQKYTAILTTDRIDIRVAEYIVALFHDALTNVANTFGLPAIWSATTDVAVGKRIYPTTPNGYYYECVVAGTTGDTEPTWTTDWGDRISDGTVVWECRGDDPYSLAENLFAQVQTDMSVLDDVNGGDFWRLMNVQFKTINTYNNHDKWSPQEYVETGYTIVPTTDNGYYYECIEAHYTSGNTSADSHGYTGTTEPTWPTTIGDTVTETNPNFDEDTVVWICKGQTSTYEIIDEEGFVDVVDAHINDWLRRYKAEAERILVAAQIEPEYKLPNFEQASTDDSSGSTDLCWQEPDDGAPYWEINGGEYLPALTNVVYHSCKDVSCGDEKIVPEPTREFAFVIKVKCEQLLKDGDTIIIDIDIADRRAYQVGDEFSFTIYGAQSITLAGGADGNDTLTWKVNGSKHGDFAQYLLDLNNPQPYSDDGLSFLITPGGIPFQLGDRWTFEVSGYQFQWRKNGGNWVGPLEVANSVALTDGLVAEFTPGSGSSYKTGDYFKFHVYQPNSYRNALIPDWQWWRWETAGATLTADFIAEKQIDAIVLMGEFATGDIVLEASNDGFATTTWSETVNVLDSRKLYVILTNISARYIRVTVNTTGKLLWLYVGRCIALSTDSQSVSITRNYALSGSRKAALVRSGTIRGMGYGGEIAWDGWLYPDDLSQLLAMIDYLKESGDEPMVFVPHIDYPDDAVIAKVNTEEIRIDEWYMFQVNDKAKRMHSLKIPLLGVPF